MKRLIPAILCLLTLLPAQALTLEEARRLATENYPLVRDYNLLALTERYTLENAATAWLPQINVGAQATWQTAVAAYPDVLKEMLAQRGLDLKGMDRLQYKAQLDVRQTIWDGGRIGASKQRLVCEAEENRLSDEVEIYQLRSRIDDIYFSLLLLAQQEEAIVNTCRLLEGNLQRVKALVEEGAAMQADADAMEAELLATRQQALSAGGTRDAFRAVLALYIGERAQEPLEMPAEIPIPASYSSARRPEQQLLTARVATIDARRRETELSSNPQIGAFAQGYFGYPGLNFMEAMMKRDPSFNAIVGLSLSWNVSSLYTRKRSLSLLSTAAQRVEVARDVFDFNTTVQATRQVAEVERLRRISATDDDIIALRARVRDASEARLQEGIVEPTDLLLRITEEKNAVTAANSHRIEYLKALYQLQTALNLQ